MKHLGEEIIQKGFNDLKTKSRDAARAIIFNDDKEVLFIYSSYYNDVSMPGGGVDEGEDLIEALYRECLEEAGAVLDSHKEYYKITEKRANITSKEEFNIFTSYYYICTYSKLVEPSLLDYEIKLGYENRWLSLDEAIKLNEKALIKLTKNKKYTGVITRELRILNKLKEDFI